MTEVIHTNPKVSVTLKEDYDAEVSVRKIETEVWQDDR